MAFSKALSTMCQMVEKGKMFLGGHFGILEIGIHFAKRQFFTGEILCFILNHLNKTQNWDEKYVFFFRKSTFIMCCMICLKFCPSIPWIQINHLHIGNTVKLSESVKTMKCHKNHSAQYKFPLKQSQLTYYKKKNQLNDVLVTTNQIIQLWLTKRCPFPRPFLMVQSSVCPWVAFKSNIYFPPSGVTQTQ